MRPDHKNAARVAIAPFGDWPKLPFTSGRLFSWDEPNPGGKITPRPECLRVRDSGGNGARANEADPGNTLQSLARLVGAMLQSEPPLDRANHRLQRLQLCGQHDQARTGINRKTGILFVRDDLQQLLEPLASLRCHNTELSQMRPQGIITC